MEAVQNKPEIDREKVREVLAQFTLPVEVERMDTAFGNDSTGDSAVTITFRLKDNVHIESKELTRLTDFLSQVTSALLQADIGGFPYTRLEQAA